MRMLALPTVIVRSRFGRPLTILVAGTGAALAVTIGINDGARHFLIALACALAATAAAHALWWQPELRLDERGLTVRNLLVTHRVGWGAYQRCGGRWGLELITDDGARVPVSAAPRQGGLSIGISRRIERSRTAVGEDPGRGGLERLLPGAGDRGLDGAHGRGRPIVMALTAERAADLIDTYRARLDSAAPSSRERGAQRNPGAIAVISIAAIAVVVAGTLVLV